MPIGPGIDTEWFPPKEHPVIQKFVAILFPTGLALLTILLAMWYLDPTQFPQKIHPLLSILFFVGVIVVGIIFTMMFTSPGRFSPEIQYLVAVSFLVVSALSGILLTAWELRLLKFLE